MSSPVAIDPLIMSRLGFIRMLYQQGIDQSQLPDPLNAASVLTLHDATELLLVLTAEHRHISIQKYVNFMDYWKLLDPAKQVGGVKLTSAAPMWATGVKRA
jgi:hypothetical protein